MPLSWSSMALKDEMIRLSLFFCVRMPVGLGEMDCLESALAYGELILFQYAIDCSEDFFVLRK